MGREVEGGRLAEASLKWLKGDLFSKVVAEVGVHER